MATVISFLLNYGSLSYFELTLVKQLALYETILNTISYPLFVPRIRKGTHLKESVFPEAEG